MGSTGRNNAFGSAANYEAYLDRSKMIAQAKFTEEGNGNWQFDIDGIGGGQVLDETGSTRALRYGNMPNQRTYSATVWTYENGTPTVTNLGMFSRRNQAQTAIKNALRANDRTRLEQSDETYLSGLDNTRRKR